MIWRGVRALAASALRALAALLLRLSRALESGHPAPAAEAVLEPPPEWSAQQLRTPPAHWVDLVRERAPELLDGSANGRPPVPTRPSATPSRPAAVQRTGRPEHRIVQASVAASARAAEPAPHLATALEAGRDLRAAPHLAPARWAADLLANPAAKAREAGDLPANHDLAPPKGAPTTRVLPLSGIGIRVRAQVEELPGDAWRTASPPAGPAAPPAEADLRAGRPEPVFASAEPAERWPDLPPSLEAPAGGPGLREWERIRGLMAEQRGG